MQGRPHAPRVDWIGGCSAGGMSNESPFVAELCAILKRIAPESEPEHLDLDADIREALDIDSMDFVRFAAEVRAHFGISVPNTDVAELTTLRRVARYLEGKGAHAA